jgi:hypothetical protein
MTSKALTITTRLRADDFGTDDNNVLALVEEFVDMCLYMPPRYRTAMALWILHAHVYDQFDHTPRLAFLSPAPAWGKSQALKLIAHLMPLPKPDLILDTTPAGLYQSIDAGMTALLIDEADNLNLKSNARLRTILNAFEKGAVIPRGRSPNKDGEAKPKYFRPFTPIALGAIGKLPQILITRCITIHMEKKPAGVEKWRINTNDHKFVEAANLVLGEIMKWAGRVVRQHAIVLNADSVLLNQNADVAGLDNRFADVWRPLLAIADTFGWGEAARNAARAISGEYANYDDGTQLLLDIRAIFNRLKIDRIEREVLRNELIKLERWNEWGRHAVLTKNEMMAMLRDFRVPPVHPIRIKGKLEQGWMRKDFEEAWKSC